MMCVRYQGAETPQLGNPAHDPEMSNQSKGGRGNEPTTGGLLLVIRPNWERVPNRAGERENSMKAATRSLVTANSHVRHTHDTRTSHERASNQDCGSGTRAEHRGDSREIAWHPWSKHCDASRIGDKPLPWGATFNRSIMERGSKVSMYQLCPAQSTSGHAASEVTATPCMAEEGCVGTKTKRWWWG